MAGGSGGPWSSALQQFLMQQIGPNNVFEQGANDALDIRSQYAKSLLGSLNQDSSFTSPMEGFGALAGKVDASAYTDDPTKQMVGSGIAGLLSGLLTGAGQESTGKNKVDAYKSMLAALAGDESKLGGDPRLTKYQPILEAFKGDLTSSNDKMVRAAGRTAGLGAMLQNAAGLEQLKMAMGDGMSPYERARIEQGDRAIAARQEGQKSQNYMKMVSIIQQNEKFKQENGRDLFPPETLNAAKILTGLQEHESGGNPNAVSSKGALGMEQMMPPTKDALTQKYGKLVGLDPNNPNHNSAYALMLLTENLVRNNGNLEKSLRQYHGGLNEKNWGPINEKYYDGVMGQVAGLDKLAQPQAPVQAQGQPTQPEQLQTPMPPEQVAAQAQPQKRINPLDLTLGIPRPLGADIKPEIAQSLEAAGFRPLFAERNQILEQAAQMYPDGNIPLEIQRQIRENLQSIDKRAAAIMSDKTAKAGIDGILGRIQNDLLTNETPQLLSNMRKDVETIFAGKDDNTKLGAVNKGAAFANKYLFSDSSPLNRLMQNTDRIMPVLKQVQKIVGEGQQTDKDFEVIQRAALNPNMTKGQMIDFITSWERIIGRYERAKGIVPSIINAYGAPAAFQYFHSALNDGPVPQDGSGAPPPASPMDIRKRLVGMPIVPTPGPRF